VKETPILFSSEMIRAILYRGKIQTRRVVIGAPDAPDYKPVAIVPPFWSFSPTSDYGESRDIRCPYGVAGDRLWIRETWGLHAYGDGTDWYRGSVRGATEDSLRAQWNLTFRADYGPIQDGIYWRPGIFMPRWASRITLEITEVRVQRLWDITDDDARAEGVEPYTPPHGHISPDQRVPGPGFERCRLGDQPHRLPYADLWDQINGKRRRREYLSIGDPGHTADRPWRTVIDESAAWAANPWIWAITFKKVER
jgi:hypothetical protein